MIRRLAIILVCLTLGSSPSQGQVLRDLQQQQTEPSQPEDKSTSARPTPDESKPTAPAPNSAAARAELSRASGAAIQKGVKFLLSHQNVDGSWGDGEEDPQGGHTALVTLALLYSGESYQSPAMVKAIKFLKAAPAQRASKATYSVALRASVYASLPEAMRKDELRLDLRWLQRAMLDGERRGMYSYGEGRFGGDYSNSQYGVLGVWYAALAGLEVPKSYWKQVEDAWRAGQNIDGGWGYHQNSEPSYASMTAAGAATLYITNDYLHVSDAQDLNRTSINKPLDDAMNWLAQNFAPDQNSGYSPFRGPRRGFAPPDRAVSDMLGDLGRPKDDRLHYMLFGYERVGEASGLTRFGDHKWYDEGADYLTKTQEYDGSWPGDPWIGTECNTSYALLFLSRGRAPVVAQKLQFDGRWNNRPRDVASFTQFMRRATERHVNWQVVSIDAQPYEFRESPLLYVASDRALNLTSEQIGRLKSYIDQGGLLVCVNEGTRDEFARSITAMAAQMYPAYAFRDLPPNHLVYTANFTANREVERIRGLSNGLRELIVLYPVADMSWKWHSTGGGFLPRNTPYASLANLWLYATDRANPRYKGEDIWTDTNPAVAATRTVPIARIRYDGNWDPEPAGWQRLASIMHNLDQCDLTVRPTREPKAEPLAFLTATQSVQLDPAMKSAIQTYISRGGLLMLEAAGGSNEAAGSFDPLLHEIFPNVVIAPLPLTHPIYHAGTMGGQDIKEVKYRRSPDLTPVHIPRLRGASINGKLIAILSYEDLSAGLVGYSTAGITGYTPDSATDLMRNIILWRSSAMK